MNLCWLSGENSLCTFAIFIAHILNIFSNDLHLRNSYHSHALVVFLLSRRRLFLRYDCIHLCLVFIHKNVLRWFINEFQGIFFFSSLLWCTFFSSSIIFCMLHDIISHACCNLQCGWRERKNLLKIEEELKFQFKMIIRIN